MNVLACSKDCWNQHVHQYYPLISPIRGELSWNKSTSVWYEILRLFVNGLTDDDKYSDINMQNLRLTISNAIISETKDFFSICYCIS